MRVSGRPAWLAVVAAPMRKLCPLYCSQFRRPLARGVCWSSSTNLSRVRGCPDNTKSGRSQSGVPVARACSLSSPSGQMSRCAASPTVSSQPRLKGSVFDAGMRTVSVLSPSWMSFHRSASSSPLLMKAKNAREHATASVRASSRLPRVRSCPMIVRSTGRVTGRRYSRAWVPSVRLTPRKT